MTPRHARSAAGKLLLGAGDVLLINDVQNDFLPGGALGVAQADAILPVMNRYIELFAQRQLPIIATRDWHPPNHSSFAVNGGIWPVHCVQNTQGAQLSAQLVLPANLIVIDKGALVDRPGYSGFEQPQLQQTLQRVQCRRLFIGGLTTDYCVLQTATAACELGYRVVLLIDAMRAVDVQPGDGDRALARLQQLGAQAITLAALNAAGARA